MSGIVATGSLVAPLFLLHLLTTAVALSLLWFSLRNRTSPTGLWFVCWLVTVCIWVGAHTLGLVVADPGVRTVTDSIELAALPASAACWLVFACSYSGRWDGDGLRIPTIVGIPTAVVLAFVLTNPVHGLLHQAAAVELRGGVAVVTGGQTSSLIWSLLVYVVGLYACGLVLLEELVRSTNRLYRDQTVALGVAVALPIVVAGLTMAGLSPLIVDATPLSFTASAVPLAYAVFRTEVLQLLPASYRIGERTVLEAVDHGVLVLDGENRVVFSNAVVQSILGLDDQWMLGRTADRVVDASGLVPGVSWLDAGRGREDGDRAESGESASAGETDVPRTLRDEAAGRTYRVTASESVTPEAEDVYRTLIVEDVTEERRRRQRLLVLNRIVRHNLRNDLTALRGHAELLAEQVDDDAVAVVDDIATDLTRLGEKAHEMDQVMREADADAQVINVASVVEQVADEVEARTGATVEVWGDVQAWTRTQPELVEAIVSNLIELSVRRHEERAGVAARGGGGPTDGARLGGGRGGPGTGVGSSPGGRGGDSGDVARRSGHVPARTGGGPTGDGRVPETPTIVVTVSADPDAVRLSVEDDGPGIPEAEVRTLLDHEGAPLPHGASIGLWVVKWCVDIADADWEIETDGWTRVTVSFPSESELQGTATGLN